MFSLPRPSGWVNLIYTVGISPRNALSNRLARADFPDGNRAKIPRMGAL
jgi:hypothetical protein